MKRLKSRGGFLRMCFSQRRIEREVPSRLCESRQDITPTSIFWINCGSSLRSIDDHFALDILSTYRDKPAPDLR